MAESKSSTQSEVKVSKASSDTGDERGAWDSKLEYILSSIGYAVGLGNVWRFPYLCFRNGGGAFLLPYLILLVLCGLPIYLLENSLGQFSSQGPARAFNGMPIMKGIGFSMMAVSSLVAPYYNVILSWVLYYISRIVKSMFTAAPDGQSKTLPWASCPEGDDGELCYTREETKVCENLFNNLTEICPPLKEEYRNITHTSILNLEGKKGDVYAGCETSNGFLQANDAFLTAPKCRDFTLRVTSPELFYEKEVLGLPDRPEFTHHTNGTIDNIGDLNGLQWHLVITLFLSWVIIAVSIIKGVKSTGKTMYFTATFPYLVLTVLLIKGLTLEGAFKGIKFFLQPKTDKLTDPTVWKDAATQIFYSLSVSWGGLLTLSSYNPFRNNLVKDTYIVVCANSGTSIYAGLAIFAYLGYMAEKLNLPIEAVVQSGPGFAFIIWPEAMTHISSNFFVQAIFSLIFFMMLYSLGLSTMVVTVETVVTSILDCFTNLRTERVKVVFGIILVNLLIGLPLITSRGLYWFQVFDDYAASYSLVFSAVCEMLAISWIYGLDRFSNDLKMMTDQHLNNFFRYAWSIFTPVILIVTLIFNIVKHKYSNLTYYGTSYTISSGTSGPLAVFLVFWPISCIVGLAIREIVRQDADSLAEKFKLACKPTNHWGPMKNSDRAKYNELRDDDLVYRDHREINNENFSEEKQALKNNENAMQQA